MTIPGPLAAVWFARAFHEISRDHHLLLYGNVNDLVCWESCYQPLPRALSDLLALAGFEAVASYDMVDGLTYADEASRDFFQASLGSGDSGPDLDTTVPVGADEITNERHSRLSDSARQLQQSMNAAQNPTVRTPTDLLGAARRVLTQQERPCALVLHQADLIFGSTAAMVDSHRCDLIHLSKIFVEAAHAAGRNPGETLRNRLIMVMTDLSALPAWIYRDNPHTATVAVTVPTPAERAAFLASHIDRFAGGAEMSQEEVNGAASTLANLTGEMTILDLRALAATSRLTKIPLSAPRRLVMRHRFGLREDPWEQLDVAKVRSAASVLGKRVIGQERAVRAVVDVLVNARGGLDFQTESDQAATRPKGVFFFVGPTGVGKTELAKAIAELVFEDENALRRFDMSEFSQEHAAERLTGAPPGYIGHEAGGVLTNWMIERPFSVVLFDEIEKAHPKIFDKFLQVIDDGRITDGQGRTAFFSQSIVIFTSNLGASTLPQLLRAFPVSPPHHDAVAQHFEDAVREFFSNKLGRPELLGRLGGGIIPFDILREEVLAQIVGKFLGQLAVASATRGYELIFDRGPIERFVAEALAESGLALGARQIRSPLLDEWVRTPLNRFVIENDPPPGTRIWVRRSTPGEPFVVEQFPSMDGPHG